MNIPIDISGYIDFIRTNGFKKANNTLERKRGKFGVEIIDMENLTWYIPKTAQNSEQHWQYTCNLERMLWDIVVIFKRWLVAKRHERINILNISLENSTK